MSKSLSEIPMTKVKLQHPYVEAIEVTQRYINSLPNAGSVLQRFAEQVEILHDGPVKKKTYAVVGEYIVAFDVEKPGSKGPVTEYVVISAAAFKALFEEYDADDETHGEVQYADLPDPVNEVQTDVRDVTTPLEIKAPPVNETPHQKAEREKKEAKEKRRQELLNTDTDGLEKSLGDSVEKQ